MSARNDDFVVILWYHGEKGRPFDTISDKSTSLPNAYALEYLETNHKNICEASTLVKTAEDLKNWTSSTLLSTVTANSPLFVPISVAKSELGWTDFHFVGEKDL